MITRKVHERNGRHYELAETSEPSAKDAPSDGSEDTSNGVPASVPSGDIPPEEEATD